jgi:hypothetical protein
LPRAKPLSTEAEELHRIISASVRDMLDAYRIQATAGPVTEKALEEIIFRAEHGVLQSLAPYPRAQPQLARARQGCPVDAGRLTPEPARSIREEAAHVHCGSGLLGRPASACYERLVRA